MQYALFVGIAIITFEACSCGSFVKFKGADTNMEFFAHIKYFEYGGEATMQKLIGILKRNLGIQTPIFLNMDAQQRNSICEDISKSPQLKKDGFRYSEQDGNDESTSIEIVEQVLVGERNTFTTPEIMLVCRGARQSADVLSNFLPDTVLSSLQEDTSLFVSSTFLQQIFGVGIAHSEGVEIIGYGSLSPKYVQLSQGELEQYYLSLRLPVEQVRHQWSQIAELIETHDPFSALSADDESRLCASVLETGHYREENYAMYESVRRRANDEYVVEPLALVAGFHPLPLYTQNIVCEAQRNGKKISIYLTRSYNDENSVFVQRKRDNYLFLEAYIRDIPILMNKLKKGIDREFALEKYGFSGQEFYHSMKPLRNVQIP